MTRARDIANFGDGIATADIGDGQITTAKIASGAITDALLPAGSVLQVVRATDTTLRTTSSTSFVDANISVTITPTSATSVIVLVWSFIGNTGNTNRTIHAQITDSSNSAISGAEETYLRVQNEYFEISAVLLAYASPATTSAVTYKGRFKASGGGVNIRNDTNTGQLYAIEVAA